MHHHSSDQDRERQKMEWKEMEGFFFLCVVCWSVGGVKYERSTPVSNLAFQRI